jgi:hypothetical protein
VVIEFPPKIDASWLEGAIARSAAEQSDSVTIRLQAWNDMHLFAEGRLLQWMRHFQEEGKEVLVELGCQLPGIEEEPRHKLWELFRDRLGAVILTNAADEVRDSNGGNRREEIKQLQVAGLARAGGEIGFGRERALLRLDRLVAPPSFRAFTEEEDDFSHLRSRVSQLAKDAFGLKPKGLLRERLTSFVHELVANTRVHARDDLTGQAIEAVRFAQLRRLIVNRQQGMGQLTTEEGPVQGYLQRLASQTDAGVEAVFVELTVADSGVGIPARLRGSTDIYGEPLAVEKEATLEAMLLETSSRPASVMGRGKGLDTALRMADLLHGLVAIRTGRLELVRDTTLSGAATSEWHITERPHLPGTTVSILLPWWPGAQIEIDQAAG